MGVSTFGRVAGFSAIMHVARCLLGSWLPRLLILCVFLARETSQYYC